MHDSPTDRTRSLGMIRARANRLMILVGCVLTTAAVALASTGAAASAGSGAPATLAGVWHHEFPDNLNQHIAFRGSTFLVYVALDDAATMQARFDGDRVTFYDSNTCSGSGTYRWSVRNSELHFELLGADPCHRAQLLPATDWTRS